MQTFGPTPRRCAEARTRCCCARSSRRACWTARPATTCPGSSSPRSSWLWVGPGSCWSASPGGHWRSRCSWRWCSPKQTLRHLHYVGRLSRRHRSDATPRRNARNRSPIPPSRRGHSCAAQVSARSNAVGRLVGSRTRARWTTSARSAGTPNRPGSADGSACHCLGSAGWKASHRSARSRWRECWRSRRATSSPMPTVRRPVATDQPASCRCGTRAGASSPGTVRPQTCRTPTAARCNRRPPWMHADTRCDTWAVRGPERRIFTAPSDRRKPRRRTLGHSSPTTAGHEAPAVHPCRVAGTHWATLHSGGRARWDGHGERFGEDVILVDALIGYAVMYRHGRSVCRWAGRSLVR
jgi:hypothetical protein